MSNFTEGEWKLRFEGGYTYLMAGEVSLMSNVTYYPWNSENIADWHLMAASKDMFKAIDKLLNCISETRGSDAREAVELGEKALAKARGES